MGQTAGNAEYKPRFAAGAALASRDFRYLWFGIITMMAGLQMQGIARGYFVYDLTSSSLILGLVASAFAFPMLGLSLFGGALADRLKKKRIIQVCQALGSLTAAAVAIAISTGRITWVHLLISSLINGVIFAFMVPARTALIPQLVSREHATNAYALNAAAMSATTLLAPAFAGNLYNWIGASGVFFVIAGLQASAVIFTGMVHTDDQPAPRAEKAIFKEIGSGLSYIRNHKLIIVLIALGVSTALLAMPFRSFLPVFIVDVFGRGPRALGTLVSIMGIGSIVGTVTITIVGRRGRGIFLLTGGILSAVSLILAAVIPVYAFVAVLMITLGLGDAFRRALTMALIMESTEPEFQGRVSSVYTMNFGLMPLGTLPAGLITEYFGVQAATGTLGILLLIICIAVLISQPKLRRLR
ncbi:MAG: MFS transporter [Spirochaetales bacterium]|jgi:MFS family permease|nr:MFS transporter [Spirochaetales bacterium]